VNWHEYGFTDVDGTSPDIWQHMEDTEKRGMNLQSIKGGRANV
jgi:hypothetical protein